jgi:hypothetical protein
MNEKKVFKAQFSTVGENELKTLRAVHLRESDVEIIENRLIIFVWKIRFRK